MTSPSTLLPLLLRHSLPHVKSHGFTIDALSRASLSLPAPYHYSDQLSPSSIEILFGSGRAPQRALVNAWLEEKRAELHREFKGKAKDPSLQQVMEKRLEMNEEVRPWLAEAFALFSITSTPLPLVGVGLKTPFPLLNHSLHIANDALSLSSPKRPHLHNAIPLSLTYLTTELHQLSLPISESSMPSTRAFLTRRLEDYGRLQENVDGVGEVTKTAWNAVRGAVKSRV